MRYYLAFNQAEQKKIKNNRFFTKRALSIFFIALAVILSVYVASLYLVLYKVGKDIRADGGYDGICNEPSDLGYKICWKKI